MPALPGAVEVCGLLRQVGYELVCITAAPTHTAAARLSNLTQLGINVREVPATGHPAGVDNPKAAPLHQRGPACMVDDYMPNLGALPAHTTLYLVEPHFVDSPNLPLIGKAPFERVVVVSSLLQAAKALTRERLAA